MKIIGIILLIIFIPTMLLVLMMNRRKKKVTKFDENSMKKIQGEMITVGIDTAFPPMTFLTEKRQPAGFDMEFILQAATPMGVNMKVRAVNWAEKERLLEIGSVDCLWSGLSITESRRKNFIFSKPYLNTRIVLLSLSEEKQARTKEDLETFAVGVQTGSSAEEKLKELLGEELPENIRRFANYGEVLEALDQNSIDLCAIDETFYLYATKKSAPTLSEQKKKWPDYIKSPLILGEEQYAVAFRPEDQDLCDKLNHAIDKMTENKELQSISDLWFDMDLLASEEEAEPENKEAAETEETAETVNEEAAETEPADTEKE
ncbi:MAG: ABC transporter substrate-binding protein [Eubacteriales bacterium]|nr:ABC transporter substrate-binding protein [Eubacteriales bacterium]